MSEQPTLHDDEPVYDDAVDDAWTDEDPQELPRRPKRRLVTPWTLGLAAVLVAALGFIGGVQVQKGEQDDGAAAGLPAGLRAAMAGGAGGMRGGAAGAAGGGASAGGTADGAAPTMGTVASKDGGTLYVTDSSGATVKVKTNGNSKVTRTARGKVASVHPGDTVVITGSTNANGTVTATQITATADGVSAGGFGGGAGGAGGFPGGGGNGGPPSGAAGAPGAPGAPTG